MNPAVFTCVCVASRNLAGGVKSATVVEKVEMQSGLFVVQSLSTKSFFF